MTPESAVAGLLALGTPGRHPAGAVLGVRTTRGTEVAVAGWAQLPGTDDAGVPLTRDIRLDLASVTKAAATTVLAMRLVADGRLRLETQVRDFLPAFRDTGADAGGKDRVTVEHLLTHTAGLEPWWPLYFESTTRDEAIERAQTLPLATAPGIAWRYSDLGLILAGRVVELAAGMGLADAFQQLIAAPLGLRAGYGPIPAEQAATSADSDAYEFGMIATGTPYPVPFTPEQFAGWRDRPLRGEVDDGNAAHALEGVSGHAGLFASVDDLLTLGAAVRDDAFVPSAVLERFAVPSAIEPTQAVGFRRESRDTPTGPLTLMHHSGFTGTWFALGIEQELVVAGGALRLHGTLGPLFAGRGGPPTGLATGPQITEIMRDAGLSALAQSTAATSSEAR